MFAFPFFFWGGGGLVQYLVLFKQQLCMCSTLVSTEIICVQTVLEWCFLTWGLFPFGSLNTVDRGRLDIKMVSVAKDRSPMASVILVLEDWHLFSFIQEGDALL